MDTGFNWSCFHVQEIMDEVANIDLVVNLKLREDVLVTKCLGRRICSQCGGNFNVASIDVDGYDSVPRIFMPPLLPPPSCASKMTTRADDTEEVVRARLRVYYEEVLIELHDGADLFVSQQKTYYLLILSWIVLVWLFTCSEDSGVVWVYHIADVLFVICRVNLSKSFIAGKACCSILMWLVAFQRHGHDCCLHWTWRTIEVFLKIVGRWQHDLS